MGRNYHHHFPFLFTDAMFCCVYLILFLMMFSEIICYLICKISCIFLPASNKKKNVIQNQHSKVQMLAILYRKESSLNMFFLCKHDSRLLKCIKHVKLKNNDVLLRPSFHDTTDYNKTSTSSMDRGHIQCTALFLGY